MLKRRALPSGASRRVAGRGTVDQELIDSLSNELDSAMDELQRSDIALDNCQSSRSDIQRMQASSRARRTEYYQRQNERIAEQERALQATELALITSVPRNTAALAMVIITCRVRSLLCPDSLGSVRVVHMDLSAYTCPLPSSTETVEVRPLPLENEPLADTWEYLQCRILALPRYLCERLLELSLECSVRIQRPVWVAGVGEHTGQVLQGPILVGLR